jgi:hypothetical protein
MHSSLSVDLNSKQNNIVSYLQSTATDTPWTKRRVLDESGYCLEVFLMALSKTNDNSRIRDSCITSIQDYLHPTETCADYAKIFSSISINYVKVNG